MKNGNSEGPTRNIIAQGTSIQGDIDSSGDFRIEGSLKGNIIVKGKIVIDASGVVEGHINCQSADISGKAIANMKVDELTTLRATSDFKGEIATKKLSIEPGAVFTGKCQMGEVKQGNNKNTVPAENRK